MPDSRVGDASGNVSIVFIAHSRGVKPVPRVQINSDQPLCQWRWLAHEEPMPPRGGEPRVAATQRFADGHVTENDQVAAPRRGGGGEPLDDVPAPIVTDGVEASMAEQRHEGK